MTGAGKRLLFDITVKPDSERGRILTDRILAIEAEAVAAERARIRAAVEGLPECFHMSEDHDDHMTLSRAVVLAAIDGGDA